MTDYRNVVRTLKRLRHRWVAEVTYKDGTDSSIYNFEELEELHDLIERGPDWNTIDRIVITYNLGDDK